MNAVEQMQGQVAALSRRVEQLEMLLRFRAETSKDEQEAQRIAQVLGFSVEVVMIPKASQERRKLARELRGKGWSIGRIARALRCCERTAARMVA